MDGFRSRRGMAPFKRQVIRLSCKVMNGDGTPRELSEEEIIDSIDQIVI